MKNRAEESLPIEQFAVTASSRKVQQVIGLLLDTTQTKLPQAGSDTMSGRAEM